jgi:hypothetical protein
MKYFIALIYWASISVYAFGQNPYEVKPKSDEPKKTELTQTGDEKFISENFPFIHMADWKPGMRFIVETDEHEFSRNELRLYKYKKSKSNFSGILQKDYQGKIFTLTALEERQVSCPKGRCTRTYVVFDCDGKKFEYEFIGSIYEMRQHDVSTTIDYLIYIDEIDKARELLMNKKLYFLNDPLSRHSKFIPITITNIGIGSTLFHTPVKIVYLTESGKEYSIDIKLSGINTNSVSESGYFYEKFSFENPREKHPEISDETWVLIQNGEVKIGMTEEECRLSWGTPKRYNRNINSRERIDQWVYFSSYLYFQDGKLTSIQN